MSKGRKPTKEPALAYDYRRYILLVQIWSEFMATNERREALMHLIKSWDVPTPMPSMLMSNEQLMTVLSRYVIKEHEKAVKE